MPNKHKRLLGLEIENVGTQQKEYLVVVCLEELQEERQADVSAVRSLLKISPDKTTKLQTFAETTLVHW